MKHATLEDVFNALESFAGKSALPSTLMDYMVKQGYDLKSIRAALQYGLMTNGLVLVGYMELRKSNETDIFCDF